MSATAFSRRRPERYLGLATVLALVLALEGCVRSGSVNAAIVPPPSVVIAKLGGILTGGDFAQPLAETLYLLFASYAIGCALAVGLGLLMGRYAFVHGLFEPLVEFLRPLPKPALLPPLILFLGLGDAMKMTAVALGVFFPVLINTVQGVRGTDPVLLDVARTFGHKPTAAVFKVVLPSALPLILAGMRVSLGLGLVLVIVAEMMAGTGGIGFLVIDMQRSFRSADMYAWIVILAVLGYGLNALFVRLERRLIHWSLSSTD
ncbi:ABC transporter permease [Ramlibacter rhizophilus]|uniref:ABC transporter permease n=1 Tax=Ramlibacter rhizophilus TaxID=1781167 RepID=A0A4Z0BGC7_9BURK|nr:ABC transporter permease [Ramlibacter rhizophilus]TFY97439.1 ABC transporter permease [Ramlibacter rhizophilus]